MLLSQAALHSAMSEQPSVSLNFYSFGVTLRKCEGTEEALETWEFQIGGYQVLHKWLYDRRPKGAEDGRILTDEDISHYQRVVVALYLTRHLMSGIDDVINAYGGFPLVGSGD